MKTKVGAIMWLQDAWAWVLGLDSGEWQAIGTMGTLLVAIAAAIFALRQVHEARTLRIEQAKPYVALYLELGKEVDASLMFLVIRNFGTTTARDVEIVSPPGMLRAWGHASDPEELVIVDKLPVLVPGQEWRTLFDWGPDRHEAGLVDPYSFTVKSKDSNGRKLKDEMFVIDWTTFVTSRMIGVKTIHDVGKSLAKIEHHLDRWSGGVNGIKVVTRSGERMDERNQEEYDRRMAEWEVPQRGTMEPYHDTTDSGMRQASTGPEVALSEYPAKVDAEPMDTSESDSNPTNQVEASPDANRNTTRPSNASAGDKPGEAETMGRAGNKTQAEHRAPKPSHGEASDTEAQGEVATTPGADEVGEPPARSNRGGDE